MRISTIVGVVLLVCGAVLLGASSGAFDSIVADRGVDVGTADDADALVGIERNETSFGAADGDFTCVENGTAGFWFLEFDYCSDGYFSHDGVILTVTDQIPSEELEVVSVNGVSPSTGNPTVESTAVTPETDVYTVNAEVRCNAVCTGGSTVDDACQSPVGSGEAEQLPDTQRVTFDVEAAGETISVELDRGVDLQCEAGSVTDPD